MIKVHKSSEAAGWEAVFDAGVFPAPEPLAKLRANLARLQKEQRQLTATANAEVSGIAEAVRGSKIVDAAEAEAQAEQVAAEARRRLRIAGESIALVQRDLIRAYEANRDRLLRLADQRAQELLDEARQYAGKISNTDERYLLLDSTPAELKAWRATRDADAQLRLLITAWWNVQNAEKVPKTGRYARLWQTPIPNPEQVATSHITEIAKHPGFTLYKTAPVVATPKPEPRLTPAERKAAFVDA